MKNSNVLFVDTATETCQIIYSENGKTVFEFLSQSDKTGHAEIFFENMHLLQNKLPNLFETLDSLIVNIGPGRFNALRVGVGFALTVKSLFDINLMSVNSFDILKNSADHLGVEGVNTAELAIFAKWNHVYYQKSTTSTPKLCSFDNVDWSNTIALGVSSDISVKHAFSSLNVLNFNQLCFHALKIENPDNLEPIYLGHQISH